MRKTSALLLTLAACDTASVPLASVQTDTEGKAFEAPLAGQSALYVFRTTDVGTLINVTVDRPLGPLGNNTWFRVDVPPGTHDVRCAGGEASKAIELTTTPGEIRFVEARATTGWWDSRCSIGEVEPAYGRDGVLRGKRALQLR